MIPLSRHPSAWPLRAQLLALVLITVTLAIAASTAAGTAALRQYLVDRLDSQLMATAALPVAAGPGGPVRDGGRDRGRGDRRRDLAVDVVRFDAAGRQLTSISSDIRGPEPDLEARTLARLTGDPVTIRSADGDDSWRAVATAAPGGGRTVLLLSMDGVDDTMSRLLLINTAAGLIALAGGGAFAAVAVRRSLRPLVQVETTAQAVAAGDYGVRVPAGDPRTEVGSLAASFNVMVDRFQTAYAAQEASEAQARSSESRMRQFIGDASHELRTPLTSIRGFAELYRQGAVREPEQVSGVMRRIEAEAGRMGLLVEDLLGLARLDQARPLLQEPVDVLSVATDVVHAAKTVHGAHHTITLHATPQEGLPVVTGDDARLHQVLGNLVGNGVAHTPPGTTVAVSVRRDGSDVAVDVADDGPGMSPEVTARVFERFFRADSSRTRIGGGATGSGLGLSIVAAIVDAHGGSVDVQSEPGAGTRFTVRLPARD